MAAIQSGREFSSKPGARWWRVGIVTFEWWPLTWRLGLLAGWPCYIGAGIGPLVVTVGWRRWAARPSTAWTVSWTGVPNPKAEYTIGTAGASELPVKEGDDRP